MTDCRRISCYLLDCYYGDLSSDKQREVREHLEICSRCQEELAEIRFTLDALKETRAVEPESDALERSWQKIQAAVSSEAVQNHKPMESFLDLGWLAPRVAFSLLLIASGVWVGWQLRTVSSPAESPLRVDLTAPESSSQPLGPLWRHLQRTEVVMLEIMNFQAAEDDSGDLSLQLSRSLSEQLLQDGDALREELESSEEIDEELLTLIRDLERILLQIAHLGEGPESREIIEALRAAIQEQALLLRIDLAEILEKRKEKPQSEKTSLPPLDHRA